MDLNDPTSAPKIIVICVGPALSVRGGITTVIAIIKKKLPSCIRFRLITTYSNHTGSNPTERGSYLIQTSVFFSALFKVIVAAMSQRSIFHVHISQRGSMIRKGIICVLLRIFRCRYVLHGHACLRGDASENLFHEWMPIPLRLALLWGLRGCHSFLSLTPFSSEHYSRMLQIPSYKMCVFPNPVELPKNIPDRSGESGTEILFLGRIGMRKGTFDLVRAFAALPDEARKKCHLTIAGDGEAAELGKTIDNLGCALQTTVTGWVSGLKAKELLARADMLVLPSYAEGMSMAVLEAMAWGLVVITTAAGGSTDFLEHGRNCLLVSPGDVSAICAAICKVAESPELRSALGREAHRTAETFSAERYMERLISIYQGAAALHPPCQHGACASP